MAAIQAKANADALANVQKAITGALGLAPEVQLDPATVLRTAEQALSRAAIQNEAVRAGVRDPARFAATLTGNPAFAVDLQTGALRNAEAARAAVAAEIVAAPFWLPTPAAPQNGSVQVQANQPIPPAPPPPNPPSTGTPAKWGWDSFKTIMTGPAPSAAKR